MEEKRATNPTEETTCSINVQADNELRFRDMDLPKISTERDERLWTMVLSKNSAHLMDGTCHHWGGANTKPTLLDGLLKRRLVFYGHLVRKGGITLDLMIGRLRGTRPRGRPGTTWLKDLATQAKISYKEATTKTRINQLSIFFFNLMISHNVSQIKMHWYNNQEYSPRTRPCVFYFNNVL